MRRELTQNIAHELKTPVASILGYAETMLHTPGISDQQRQLFTERTLAQARRLGSLLQDISTLNRMDYAADMLSTERVDVAALVADIVEETRLAMQRRRMQFHNLLPQDIVVNGNEQLIYGIFRNLTDNAIAYAGEATVVSLSATESKTHWHFTFSDNGVGIPAEHLGRIFERFYRIDKSRSRQMGGTGLGLAIVKNAILLHGGTISVRSDSGTTFDFTLKK